MLLFLLSLFSIHCRQAEQATDSETPLSQLMHKSILEIDSLLDDFQQELRKEQSVLQVVDQEIQDAGLPGPSLTPGANHTGNYTGNYIETRPTLFPYPPGHFTTTTKDPWESWSLPGLDYSSISNPFSYVLQHEPHQGLLNQTTPFNPRHWFDLTVSISGPTTLNYSVPFTRPSFPFPRPMRPPRTEQPAPKPMVKYISNASHTSMPRFPIFRLPTKIPPAPGFLKSVTAGAKARTLSTFFAMSDLQGLERERSWQRPRGQRLTMVNRMRATAARRPQPQLRKSTLSKAQAWVQNRQWMKNRAGMTLQRHIRQGEDNAETTTTPKAISVDNDLTKPTVIPVGNPLSNQITISVGNPLGNQITIPVGNMTAPTPISVNNTLETTAPHSNEDTESYVSFSVPGLSDILPSMSLPGLVEARPTTAAKVTTTQSTTPDPLYVHSTSTAFAITEQLIVEGEDGFLYVSLPASLPEPTTESTTSTLGLVLVNAHAFTASTTPEEPHEVLTKLMETMDEGFLPVFLLELARLIATKPAEQVHEVFRHFEIIYNQLDAENKLGYFEEDILELGTTVSRVFSGPDVSTLQVHANMMHGLLKGRREYVGAEVNSIIDYADMMYEDDEGQELFDSLTALYYFPDVTISSYDVCFNMMTCFLKPYRRLRGSDRLRKLTHSLLKVVAVKFDNRRRGDTAIRERNQTISKTRRNPSSLRQRIQRRRLQMKRRQQQMNPLVVRAVLPITKHQKRFRVITPKQLRSNGYMGMLRPTQAYFRRKLGRPVHPQGGVLSLFPEFPQARDVEFKSRAQPAGEEPHHPKDHATQPTPGAMRKEVRRIFEESSYSDEEASLKRNLRHALRVNWHRTYTSTGKTSKAVAK